LVAQIVDAKALGLRRRPSGIPSRMNSLLAVQEEMQDYIVKTTETYSPTTTVGEDNTIEVTFTRVTETITQELQTGSDIYIAVADAIQVERLVDEPGRMVIQNISDHQFRLLNGADVIVDWMSSDQTTIEWTFDPLFSGLTIESRSLNATVTFVAYEDFNYTLQGGNNTVIENIKDNQAQDLNDIEGTITLGGLIEGESYEVAYEGYRLLETITQDEVEGKVDKLYVLYQYTFVSFVPTNVSTRPDESTLTYDTDGVSFYDKTNYFSNTTRQSFIIDNNTGLIYKIDNIHLQKIEGGILFVQGSKLPYDLNVNDDGHLTFYPLYTNESIILFEGFRDKYGNKYLLNNRLNEFDATTRTYFYVYDVNLSYEWYQLYPQHLLDVRSYTRPLAYWLMDNGEALQVTFTSSSWLRNVWLDDIRIMQGNQETRMIQEDEVRFVLPSSVYSYRHDFRPYKVQYGKVFSETYSNHRWENGVFAQYGMNIIFDAATKRDFLVYTGHDYIPAWNINYLKDHDVLLEFSQGNIIYFKDFTKYFAQAMDYYIDLNPTGVGPISYLHSQNSFLNLPSWFKDSIPQTLEYETVLENVGIEEGKAVRYGINTNVYYDIVAEVIEGKLEINAYQSGTYVSPVVTTIILQPINR
jgi:hypothetical protein